MSSSRFFQSLDRIAASATLRDLEMAIGEIRHVYGASHMVLHVQRSSGSVDKNPLLMLTYPPEWVSWYIARDYFSIDPVVRLGQASFLPVEWSAKNWESGRVRNFFTEAQEFGVGWQGITLPVRGPKGERSLFTFTSNQPTSQWQEFRRESMRDLQVLAHHFHDRALILSGLRQLPDLPQLSRRELQCLDLTAKGLLKKQIAARLEISVSAVQLYLTSARRKLKVATTSEAVAKATSLELI